MSLYDDIITAAVGHPWKDGDHSLLQNMAKSKGFTWTDPEATAKLLYVSIQCNVFHFEPYTYNF